MKEPDTEEKMNNKQIRVATGRYIKSINRAFKKTRHRFEQNDIHLYRVEIKKFGAFLQLLGGGESKRNHFKIPPKMRAFYKAIGLVRTLKIEENKIMEFDDSGTNFSPDQYLSLIAWKAKHAENLARKSINKRNPFKKEIKNLLWKLPKGLHKSRVKKFIGTEVNNLNELIGGEVPGDQTMHSIRKMLKGFLYNQRFAKNEIACVFKYMHLSGRDQMVTLTEALGRFQDLTTSLDLLKEDFSKKCMEDSEENILRSVEVQWTLQKETARSDIYRLLTVRNCQTSDVKL